MMQAEKNADAERWSFCYRLAMGLSAILFHTLIPITYHGLENCELDAPFILVSNHNSMFDPLAIGYPFKRHMIRFLGKKELEKVWLLKVIFRNMKMIAVDRHNMDMAAMRQCLKVLKDGNSLGIFPEGTRHKTGVMQQLESGTAMIALRSKAPVVPAYIDDKIRLFHRLNVYFGKPVDFGEMMQKSVDKDTCQAALDKITQTYDAMTNEHPTKYVK